ncbi:MAG: methyltransferase domain-containing protein [Anaerolineales bacterium]|nr:methyltransferase domain-containing protein [Anaerolineales bacterium]
MRLIKALRHIISSAGPMWRASRQGERLFRYYVLQILSDIGFFAFLQEPRTYGQILAEFGFGDIDYTRSMFEILSSDKDVVLVKEGDFYRAASENPVPDLEQLVRKTDRRMQGFILLAESLTQYILARMRQQPISLSKTFERDGREFMYKFDKLLATKLYSGMRAASFAYLKNRDIDWLRGKKLLEIGCGSGRETAEIWLRFGSDIKITAVDTVASMIELAEQNFETLIKEIDPDHPPVTEANRPVFKLASATRLPYGDDEFDAAFWMLVLHWTADPRKVIHEAARVVRPGGLIFGLQSLKPVTDNYLDFMIRSNENCYGFFWPEEYKRWLTESGLEIDLVPYAGLLRASNRKDGRP